MRLLERLGVRTAGGAASVTLHNYVSDRSVALLLRPTPRGLRVGSGTVVRIGSNYLIVTAGHNLNGLALNQIEVLPRGSNLEPPLPIVSGQFRISPDVGWLEVDSTALQSSSIKAVDLSQLGPLNDEGLSQVVVLVQGYPCERVTPLASDSDRSHVESDGLLTLVIPPLARSSIVPDVDFSVEYPPWDGSIDHLPLSAPPGASGGGVWRVPVFRDSCLWDPEQSRLLALVESWQSKSKELFCVHIEQWLSAVRQDRPEFAAEIDASINGWVNAPYTT